MICENCLEEHSGNYGSGRFCSSRCARSFSTKDKRKEISEKVSKSLKGRKPVNAGSPCSEEKKQKSRETWIKKFLDSDFESLGFGTQRKIVIYQQDYACNKCAVKEWFGHQIVLEVDHINGISDDNRRENLEALCPNCHSITGTWRGRNKPYKNGENKVTDEELTVALKEHKSIRQALLSVGLAAKGNNYARAKKLLN